MTDGVRLSPAEMTRADWEMLASYLPALKNGGTVFEWGLKLCAYSHGWSDLGDMNRTAREIWKALATGPATFGPYRIQRAGRGRIAFVCDPSWTYFRSLPRRRRSLAKAGAGKRSETAADLFNRGRALLWREYRADEEMPIPEALEASDPYGEDAPWFCSTCGSRCLEDPATGLPEDCQNCKEEKGARSAVEWVDGEPNYPERKISEIRA